MKKAILYAFIALAVVFAVMGASVAAGVLLRKTPATPGIVESTFGNASDEVGSTVYSGSITEPVTVSVESGESPATSERQTVNTYQPEEDSETTAGNVAVSSGDDIADTTETAPEITENDDPGTVLPDTDEPVSSVPAGEPLPETVERGFCAVGQVDEINSRVAVLLWNGKAAVFSYFGAAPETGTVAYCETAGEKISFDRADLDDFQLWRLYDDENGEYLYGNDGEQEFFIHFSDGCVCFLKFSDTSWNVYNEKGNLFDIPASGFQWPSTVWPCGLQALDYDGDGAFDVVFADATLTYDYSMYGGDNFVNITRLFNGNSGDISAGEFSLIID
ncbi:MAG: hypothetical protein IKS28_04340 [Clostridia bacterium]|nr:hypothetical protein [Clostridia bacterium]